MNPNEWQFAQAEELLEKGAFEEALQHYEALEQTSLPPEYSIRRGDALGYLYERLGRRDQAEAQYRENLNGLEENAGERFADRARTLNNLGRVVLRRNPKEALDCFDRSCQLYRELAEDNLAFRPHLANTLVARGEVYGMQKKYWFAKKDYKEAISLYEAMDSTGYMDHIAYSRYQLGSIYQEEFNGYDARNQYARAIAIYREASEDQPENYLPLLAAALNNMANVHEDLEDYDKAEATLNEALEAYENLSENYSDQYAPYLAATHTHLAILQAEKRSNPDGATNQIDQAVQLYGVLKAEHPDQYTHYWATSLHNAGVIRAEAGRWKDAGTYLEKALQERWELEKAQPGVFTADLCATAMNLAECYLNQIHSPEDWEFRDMALGVLEEITPVLKGLEGQSSVQNMLQDHKEMTERLQAMKRSDILCQYAHRQTRKLEDEIDGTLELDEKITYQKGILALWEEVSQSGASPEQYTREWVRALSNLGWLYIRQGDPESARELLEKALVLDPRADAALCNLAHCDLLEGRPDLANEKYRAIWKSTHEDGKGFGEVINKDLLLLVQSGILGADQLPKPVASHS